MPVPPSARVGALVTANQAQALTTIQQLDPMQVDIVQSSAELLAILDGDYDGPLPDEISKELLSSINRGEVVIDERDLDHIKAAYDAEIRSVDQAFGGLLNGLDALGLADNTLLIFTSDHGEEFGEHGVVGWHSHTLYDELLRHVPTPVVALNRTVAVAMAGGPERGLAELAPIEQQAAQTLQLWVLACASGSAALEDTPAPASAALSW